MKRSLFLLAAVTISSSLYAQQFWSVQQVQDVFEAYNPQLLERARQHPQLQQVLQNVWETYARLSVTDPLAARYELAALARNFDNSLALSYELSQYKNALRYSSQGQDVQAAARAYAARQLKTIYARIWAVSVQTKEQLLNAYKQQYQLAKTDNLKKEQLTAVQRALRADLQSLRSQTGTQLMALVQEALLQAQAQVAQEKQVLLAQAQKAKESTNLHIKTKHKKPVAE